MTIPGPCPSAHGHRFDPESGWCHNVNCGWREDGRSAYRPGAFQRIGAPVDITEPRRSAYAENAR